MTAGDPGSLNIRWSTLDEAQQRLAQAYQTITSTIDDLESQLNQSLSEWTGSAQAAYAQVKAQWSAAVADMADILKRIEGHFGGMSDMYQSTERSATNYWPGA